MSTNSPEFETLESLSEVFKQYVAEIYEDRERCDDYNGPTCDVLAARIGDQVCLTEQLADQDKDNELVGDFKLVCHW